MDTSVFKLGLDIEVLSINPNGDEYWRETKIKKISKCSIWFDGIGFSGIRKTTFLKYTQFYRIKNYENE